MSLVYRPLGGGVVKVKLARADDVPEGGMIAIDHAGTPVLLAKIEGRVWAMHNVCSHAGAPLNEGSLGFEGPCLVTCPWHDAHFDVRTGAVHQDTSWATDLPSYPVQLQDGDVWVELPG
jgi:3-phenylpropionate/trans-cinnamate dioxygenase ferredoxin subunit